MRCLTVILLVFILNFTCLGNEDSKNIVSKADSLSKELKLSKDSISYLAKELVILKQELKDVKTRSEAFDESVWEYGSSLVGIMLGLIVLFGIIYYIASTVAAKSTFDANFDSYTKRLNSLIGDTELARDRLLSNYKSFEDAYEDTEKFSSQLDNYDNG